MKKAEEDEDLPFDGIILDHNCDFEEMSELCDKKHKIIVGNLDPGVLMASEKIIQEKTEKMIKKGRKCKRFIDPQKVGFFVETLKNFK